MYFLADEVKFKYIIDNSTTNFSVLSNIKIIKGGGYEKK